MGQNDLADAKQGLADAKQRPGATSENVVEGKPEARSPEFLDLAIKTEADNIAKRRDTIKDWQSRDDERGPRMIERLEGEIKDSQNAIKRLRAEKRKAPKGSKGSAPTASTAPGVNGNPGERVEGPAVTIGDRAIEWEDPVTSPDGRQFGTIRVGTSNKPLEIEVARDATGNLEDQPAYMVVEYDPREKLEMRRLVLGKSNKDVEQVWSDAESSYNYSPPPLELKAVYKLTKAQLAEGLRLGINGMVPADFKVSKTSEQSAAEQSTTSSPEVQPDSPADNSAVKTEAEQAAPEQPADYGASNTYITAERAEVLRQKLRDKLNNINSGFDPELLALGAELAAFHIEAGARKFADFSRAMLSDLGDAAKPYLKSWYNGARDFPGFDNAGMSTHGDVDTEHTALLAGTQVTSEESGDGSTEREGTDAEQGGVAQVDSGSGEQQPGPDANADTQAGGTPKPDRPVGERETGDDAQVQAQGDTEATGDVSDNADGKASDAGQETGRSDDSGTGASTAPVAEPEPDLSDSIVTGLIPPDFILHDPASIIGGTPMKRFDKNRKALELANELNAEERQATPDEQKVLAAYTGWGSFGQELFQGAWDRPRPKEKWEARDTWLREILGQSAWKSAQRSITNAHYTDPPTVQTMWDMVKRMGFRGGRWLEPAMGVGNFPSLMPRELRDHSTLTGIELDETTGGIAKQLFPNSNISIKGYEQSQTPDGFYDLVIGNWPFEDTVVADRRYLREKPLLHDYFFLKALDQTRAGGLVIGITSKGTMDKVDSSIRRTLAKKGELVAAFRLPNGAFKQYAGTSVVTDIIILKKRNEPLTQANDAWIDTNMMPTPAGTDVRINQYYLDNPQNVLGTVDYGHTLHAPGMIVNRPRNMQDALNRAVDRVPEDIIGPETERVSYLTNQSDERVGAVYVQDEALLVSYGEQARPADEVLKYSVGSDEKMSNAQKKTNARREAELKGLFAVRVAYQDLLSAEQSPDDNPEPARKALDAAYQAHVKEYGNLSDSWGLQYLKRIQDPNRAILQGLEIEDRQGNIRPALVMKESTMRKTTSIENPSISDAFVLARNQSITPSIEDVAKAAKVSVEQARKELVSKGAVFENPAGDLVPSDIYLSGNVRIKHKEAVAAVREGRKDLQHNVDALEKVLPALIPYHEIEIQLGAPWVPLDVYSEFIAYMLNDPDPSQFDVRFRAGRWSAKFPDGTNRREPANNGFGVSLRNVHFTHIVNSALKNNRPTLYARDIDGNKFVDTQATEQMGAAVDKMREEFNDWVWGDAERRVQLQQLYNEARNSVATPSYDGSFLQMPGMALKIGENDFDLRAHQVNAIWRGIVNRRGMYAHEVGTGKSFTIAGIAVESRRYGIAKKPMVLAHNANSRALAHEINLMYPGARVLYIDNLKPDQIQQRLQQIATDDWDAIVMPHSLSNHLSFKRDTLMDMAAEEIAALEAELFEALEESESEIQSFTQSDLDDDKKIERIRSTTAKGIAKQRKTIINNIERQALRSSKEGALSFEDLGIDMILVDEVHEFKKPPIATRMSMKGLNTTANNKSIGLNFMTKYIQSQNAGGNVHTFTGTLITNTLTELYGQMRYTMPQEMIEQGIEHWDGFFGSYMSELNDIELSAAGEYENQTRLAKFLNLPELRQLVGQYMDIVFGEDMPAFAPRQTSTGKTMADNNLSDFERDELENGRTEGASDRPYKKVVTVTTDMSVAQTDLFYELQDRAAAFREMTKRERMQAMKAYAPEAPLNIENTAAKGSFDMRLIDGEMLVGQEGKTDDDPNSKASQAVRNITELYKSHSKANQVVFMGRGIATRGEEVVGTNGDGTKIKRKYRTFSTMLDIIERLVQEGVPREQIATIVAGTSGEKKKEIADAMNDGSVRIVLGSIQSMGVGVNMQKNLRAIHHLDAPWMPGELEQGNGRGHRQGNQWNTVLEYRYLTDRLDGRRWQVLAIKGKFIRNFMRSDGSERTLEGDAVSDDGGDLLSTFAEAAGDPRILVRASLTNKIEKLRRKENLYTHSIAESRGSAKRLLDEIAQDEFNLERAQAQLPAIEAWREEPFSATIDGKDYSAPGKADVALKQWVQQNISKIRNTRREIVVGTVRGKPLEVEGFRTSAIYKRVLIDGFAAETEAETSMMTAIQTQAKNYKGRIEKSEEALVTKRSDQKRAVESGKEPFKPAQQLKDMVNQLKRLEKDLDDNPVPPPSWLRQGAPVGTDVKHKGKLLEVTGHRYTAQGYFVIADTGTKEHVLPYLEVKDEQGIALYEEHEFVPPRVVGEEEAERDQAPQDSQSAPVSSSRSTRRRLERTRRRTGKARLSRDKGAKSDRMRPSALAQIIRDISAKWANGPRMQVVGTGSALPQAVLDDAAKQGATPDEIKAVFMNGTVYLVADKHTSARDVEESIFHEVYGHHGLMQLFGSKITKAMATLHKEVGGLEGLQRLADKYNVDLSLYDDGTQNWPEEQRNAVLANELLAHIAQNETGTLRQRAKFLVQAIRDWLIQHGFVNLAKFGTTQPEIAVTQLLKAAQEAVNGAKDRQQGNAESALFMVAYHGTPHAVDKFSSERIGTGEGAQAYGHGLYFTDSKKVAEHYRNALTSVDWTQRATDSAKKHGVKVNREEAQSIVTTAWAVKNGDIDSDKAGRALTNASAELRGRISDKKAKAILDTYRDTAMPGNTYQVELAPTDDEYLMWDKPMTEQSAVVNKALKEPLLSDISMPSNPDGRDFAVGVYQAIEYGPWDQWLEYVGQTDRTFDNAHQLVSAVLHKAGIRGTKYLDSVSRDKGEGGYNYVIFDDQDVEITAMLRRATASQFAMPEETVAESVIRTWQDKHRVLGQLVKNLKRTGTVTDESDAYIAEEAFHGKTENDLRLMSEQYIEPLAKLMSRFKIDQKMLDEYLYARHAPERNRHIASINDDKPDGGSGMTNAKAATEMARLAATGKMRQLERLAVIVDDMTASQRDAMRDGGLATDAQVDAWQASYRHYVPLKGFAEDEPQDEIPHASRGFSLGKREVIGALGRGSQAASPSSFVIQDLTEKLIRKRKNEVGNAFLQLVEDNPDKGYWQVFTDADPDYEPGLNKKGKVVMKRMRMGSAAAREGSEYFTTKRDGKMFYIKLKDDRLLKSMKNLGPEQSNTVMKFMSGYTRLLSMMNTSLNPEFIISNFARDLQTAGLNLSAEQTRDDGRIKGEAIVKQTMKDIPAAMKGIYAQMRGKGGGVWGARYEQFMSDGGKTGWFDLKDIDGQAARLDRLVSMADGGAKGTAMRWFDNAARFVEHTNGAVENAVRLSAYHNAVAAGLSRPKAASLAKNMTVNFNRRGEIGTMLNALYMFANASIQGTANFARTMKGFNGDGKARWRNLNRAQKLGVGIAMGAAALAMANRASSGEDDDDRNWYDKVPNAVKRSNVVIMKSLVGGAQDGTYWKIPLPYGYNVFSVLGTTSEAVMSGDMGAGSAATDMTLAILGSFSPIGFSDSESIEGLFLKNATPTIAAPMVDIALNENFFGSSIYTENLPFGTQKPDSLLARRSGNQVLAKAAKWMNETTGGSDYRSGAIDVNPDALSYFLKEFGGGSLGFVNKTVDAVTKTASGVEVGTHRLPFIGRVRGKVLPYEDRETFYERRNLIEQTFAEAKSLPGNERGAFMREHGWQSNMRPMSRFTEKQLKGLRDRRDFTYAQDMSDKAKDKRLKVIDEQMKAFIDRFNTAYNRQEKAASR